MYQAVQAVFFLVLVAGLAYLASRLMGASALRMAQGRRIRLIEVVSLGPRRHACLISVGERVFLLGVTDQCVSSIAEFSAAETEPRWGPDDAAGGPGDGDFRARLGSMLRWRREGRER